MRDKNIGNIYLAITDIFEVCIENGKSREFYWLTKEDIEHNEYISSY